MAGLQDFSTALSDLYEDAKTGNVETLVKFINNFFIYQFKELGYDKFRLLWHTPTDFDPPRRSRRFEIWQRNRIIALGAVSVTESLERLALDEATELRNEILSFDNRQVGYVILAVKDNGLKCGFYQVARNDPDPREVIENQGVVDLETADGPRMFQELVDHCLTFAC